MSAVRTVYIELRASAEKLRADMLAAQSQVATLGTSGKDAGQKMSAGMDTASISVRKLLAATAEGVVALNAAHGALAAAVTRYGAAASTSGSATEALVNTYRGLRLALSPTPFTIATIAAGLLTEETIRLTNARAKLIAQQSLIAAISGRSIGSVEGIDAAAGISGGNAGTLRSLSGVLASRGQSAGLNALGLSADDPDLLANVARGFDSIADPAERAAMAVRLFGAEHAGAALSELNLSFASASDAVKRYGLVLDSTSRTQIFQFREDIKHLGGALDDLKSNFSGAMESGKQFAEVLGAAIEDGAKRGAKSLDDWIARVTHLRGIIAPLQTLPAGASLGRQIDNRGLLADDLFAQAQGAAARKSQTLEGRRGAQGDAQREADSAYQKLADDQAKRQLNPNDPSLLTGDQRFGLATQQQSKSALAAAIGTEVKALEDAAKAEKDAAAAGLARIDTRISALGRLTEAQRTASQASIEDSRRSDAADDASLVSSQARAIGAAQSEVDAARERVAQTAAIEEANVDAHTKLLRQKFGDDKAENIRVQGEIDAIRDEANAKETAAMVALSAARQNLSTAIISATREEAKAQESYREELARTATEWNKLRYEAVAALTKHNQARDVDGDGSVMAGGLASRLGNSPIGRAVALGNAGYPTAQQSEGGISKLQELQAKMQGLNVPIQERRALQEKILEDQIALGEADGEDTSALQIKLATMRQIDEIGKKKSAGPFSTLPDRAQEIPGAVGGALAQGIVDGKGIGRDIRDSLKGIGKEMMGDIFSGIITAMLGNTIATVTNTVSTDLNSTFLAIKSFLGFAGGGTTPSNTPYWTGEKGPELRFDSRPGYIMPHDESVRYAASSAATTARVSRVNSFASHGHTFNIYESSDPRETARSVGEYLKTTWPGGSPYNGG